VALGVWCSLDPDTTAEAVGFSLMFGKGQSEFLTVYGGWEVAMGIVFLLPLVKRHWLPYSLQVCVIMHGCLVIFRSSAYLMYDVSDPFTMQLAIGEWVIFLLSFWFAMRSAT
jgi:hypothetical protein